MIELEVLLHKLQNTKILVMMGEITQTELLRRLEDHILVLDTEVNEFRGEEDAKLLIIKNPNI